MIVIAGVTNLCWFNRQGTGRRIRLPLDVNHTAIGMPPQTWGIQKAVDSPQICCVVIELLTSFQH